MTANPIWQPNRFPATLIVMAAPDGFPATSLPDPFALPFVGELNGDGLHTVVTDDSGDHRLWYPHGSDAVSAAILLPLDAHFFWRYRNAARLKRRLDGKPPGRWPYEQRLSAFQLHRTALMLRAWDGTTSGASRRTVASVLLNSSVRTLRAIEWQNAPERRRLARILAAARQQIEGGYLRWLTPRTPRR